MKTNAIKHLSIRQRLPVVICILLLSVVLSFGIISYLGVRKATLKVGEDRLQALSLQLSGMLSSNAHNIISSANAQANKAAVKKFLLTQGRDSAGEVKMLLDELRKDTSWAEIHLLSPQLRPLLVSSGKPANLRFPVNGLLSKNSKMDSGRLGKIYSVQGSVYFPVIVPVTENDRTLGYLVKWRKMQARSQSVGQLSGLMGSDARFYVGNADGSLWTDMVKPIAAYPVVKAEEEPVHYKLAGKQRVASVHRIAGSPWLVSVEFPEKKILQTAHTFLYWLLISGTLLIIIGIFFGWLMSRRLSEPLAKLTIATSRIASGDYSSPVLTDRYDEIGKLSRAFNSMMVQVQNSQSELLLRAENYKLLFEKNPMPMWIMSTETFNILDVNEAAINHYGYSREEFLQLSAVDLRPSEDIEKFLLAARKQPAGGGKHGIWRHKKKDGTIIMVDLIADDLIYKNFPARLTLAHDVTEKLKAEAELIRHRLVQQEIITETTILVQEKEREEIGRELHDNINQILASAKLYLELAGSDNKDLYAQAISKSYDNINLAIGEIRQLSKQLVRPAFDTSLGDCLQDLISEIEAITPIDICFDGSHFNENIVEESLKLMVYRIVQEQLNNILKYAAATEVLITLSIHDEHMHLTIRDNGVGFDPTKKSKGIGLRNIDTRVKFHKGQTNIISYPGEGCTIDIAVPLKTETVSLYN